MFSAISQVPAQLGDATRPKADPDGALTLYIQKDQPTEPDRRANWPPAPNGPIDLIMRLYWPKEVALDGIWKPPGLRPATAN